MLRVLKSILVLLVTFLQFLQFLLGFIRALIAVAMACPGVFYWLFRSDKNLTNTTNNKHGFLLSIDPPVTGVLGSYRRVYARIDGVTPFTAFETDCP